MQEPIDVEALDRLLRRPEHAELPVTEGLSPFTAVELTGARPAADLDAPGVGRVIVGISPTVPVDPPPSLTDVALCPPAESGATVPTGWVAVDDPYTETERLAATCAANPGASAALVQLLRVNERLTLVAGVTAESFAYSMLLTGPEFARWLSGRPPMTHRHAAEPVVIDTTETTVTITLNRPEVRNAYDAAMRDALVDVLRGLMTLDPPPDVELRGAGPGFCSGGDLSEFGTATDAVIAHRVRMARAPGPLLQRLPVTAYVHGPCVGAGVELPAFCKRVVAAPGTTFILPEVAMGLVPGAGGTASLTARIGRHRTAYLALSGAALSAPTALEWGLVDEIGG